eukprot:6196446-Prymnesium_polylepis.1
MCIRDRSAASQRQILLPADIGKRNYNLTSSVYRCAAPARTQLAERPRVPLPFRKPRAALATQRMVSADIDTMPHLSPWPCTEGRPLTRRAQTGAC